MLWINAKDDISRSGEVTLQGRVSYYLWWHSSVKGKELEFFQNGEKIGSCFSDENGFYALKHGFSKKGLHQILIILKEDPSIRGIQNILIPENKSKKILVCDVDNTLVNFSLISFIFQFGLSPLSGASEVLNELSEYYDIVYLTHRDRRFTQLTKSWMVRHEIPAGPVFFWSLKEDPFLSKRYKMKKLEIIKEKAGMPLSVGIGDRTGDIEAYESAGIKKTFLINEETDWKKIKEALLCLPM
jgi:hypothetical protein